MIYLHYLKVGQPKIICRNILSKGFQKKSRLSFVCWSLADSSSIQKCTHNKSYPIGLFLNKLFTQKNNGCRAAHGFAWVCFNNVINIYTVCYIVTNTNSHSHSPQENKLGFRMCDENTTVPKRVGNPHLT